MQAAADISLIRPGGGQTHVPTFPAGARILSTPVVDDQTSNTNLNTDTALVAGRAFLL